jgi:hypothetical protein
MCNVRRQHMHEFQLMDCADRIGDAPFSRGILLQSILMIHRPKLSAVVRLYACMTHSTFKTSRHPPRVRHVNIRPKGCCS